MIILKDSYSGKVLMGFHCVEDVQAFVYRHFKCRCSVKAIENAIEHGKEYLGFKWSYGECNFDYPTLIIMSYRHSQSKIEKFFNVLDESCKRKIYIIHKNKVIHEEFYTQRQVAEYFKMSPSNVSKCLKRGTIRGWQIERVGFKPAFDFRMLDYSQLLKYAKYIEEDETNVENLLNLDVEGYDYE